MKLRKARNAFKLVLVTESRADLCIVANTLFSAMPTHLFEDRKTPVIVTVRGAWNSGKTIFTDVIRDTFMTDIVCTSKAGHKKDRLDESHTGLYQGKPFEHGFINSAWINRFYFSHPAIQETSYKDDGRGIVFSNLRQHGGIAFVHNDDDAVMESSIDLWLEDNINMVEGTAEHSRLKETKDQRIKDLFAQRVTLSPEQPISWRRYLEISIYDHRLFENESFMQQVGKLPGLKRIERTTQAYPKAPPQRKPTPTQRRRQLKFMEDLFNNI